jgi:uncharacterized membrane protein
MIDKRAATVALGIGALGVAAATLGRRSKDVTAERAHASRSVTIRLDAQRLYDLWCASGPLPEVFGGDRDVAIVTDDPAKLLEWRNVHRKPYRGGGSLAFIPAPGERGTEVRLSLHLEGPGTHAVSAFQRLHGASPAQVARESLRRFKALAEAGEIPKAVAS